MTASALDPTRWGADPVRLAIGIGLASGLASFADPALGGLTLAVVALAVGSYLVSYRRRHPDRLRPELTVFGAFLALGSGFVGFLGATATGLPGAALVLALGAVPLAWVAGPQRIWAGGGDR